MTIQLISHWHRLKTTKSQGSIPSETPSFTAFHRLDHLKQLSDINLLKSHSRILASFLMFRFVLVSITQLDLKLWYINKNTSYFPSIIKLFINLRSNWQDLVHTRVCEHYALQEKHRALICIKSFLLNTGADPDWIVCIIWYTILKNNIVLFIVPWKKNYSTSLFND